MSYDEVVRGQEPTPYLGGPKPPDNPNEDLIIKNRKELDILFFYYDSKGQSSNFRNVFVKPGLEEQRDYRVISN